MTSYQYMAFAEWFGEYPATNVSWEIIFLSNKTGEWVSSVVDTSTSDFPQYVHVANNGSFFCITCRVAGNYYSYVSHDEAATWTKHLTNITDSYGSYFMVNANGVFGLYMDVWWTSPNGIQWTRGYEPSMSVEFRDCVYIDRLGRTHLILTDSDNVYYMWSDNLARWSEATLLYNTSDPEDGSVLTGIGNVIFSVSFDYTYDADCGLAYAISTDRGVTWTTGTLALSELVGNGYFDIWGATTSNSLGATIIDDTLYVMFPWLSDPGGLGENWQSYCIYSENISEGEISFSVVPGSTYTVSTELIQAPWFSYSINDPTTNTGAIIWSGYSIIRPMPDWTSWYNVRSIIGWDVDSLGHDTIYTLTGEDVYGEMYAYHYPAGAYSTLIPSGWNDLGCYRVFAPKGYAYLF